MIALYIAGRRIAVAVDDGDTASEVATKVNDAIGDVQGLPATASATAAVVTVTARNAGLSLDLDVRVNHQPDEVLPDGVTVTIAATAGTTDPDIDEIIAVLGEQKFDLIATPYTADADIGDLEDELEDRWSASRQLDGDSSRRFSWHGHASHHIRQCAQQSALDLYGTCRTRPTRRGKLRLLPSARLPPPLPQTRPARFRPCNSGAFSHPALPSVAPFAEANGLLTDGMATLYTDNGGNVRIQRAITTSQTLNSVPNTAYLDLNTLLTLSFLKQNFRQRVQSKWPRHKLADDGSNIGPGQPVVTPSVGRAEAVAWFREMEASGYVEGGDQFKTDLVVERNSSDPNRLDFLLPPDLINQLRVIGVRLGIFAVG